MTDFNGLISLDSFGYTIFTIKCIRFEKYVGTSLNTDLKNLKCLNFRQNMSKYQKLQLTINLILFVSV